MVEGIYCARGEVEACGKRDISKEDGSLPKEEAVVRWRFMTLIPY